jgi:NADH oxidase (H2O2-forming)
MDDRKTDILVVGGGPGGFILSVTAATCWPDKKITVVRPEEKSLIPCGIPYIFGTLGGIEEDLFYGSKEFRATGASLLLDRVASVDRPQRLALLESGERIRWDRLVISTGAEPIMPPMPGMDLEGVFTIHKEYDYMDHFFRKHLPDIKRMVVIGGGFIGVEFAEEIQKHGTEVHIVETLPHFLLAAFDEDVCVRVENELKRAGVHIHTGTKAEGILPDVSGKRVAVVRIGGAQVVGGRTTGELVNAIAIAIQTRATAAEIITFQLGAHPRLTGAEHPLITATEDALQHRS